MPSPRTFVLLLAILPGTYAFQRPLHLARGSKVLPRSQLGTPSETSTSLPLPPDKLILPPSLLNPTMDTSSIATIFLGQAVLVASVVFFEIFTNFKTLPSSNFYDFNLRAVTVATLLAIPLTLSAFVVKNIPWNFSMKVKRSREVFALRLLGYATPPIVALFVSFVLSLCAGYSEELFFRGFVYSNILASSNVPIALIGSSVIFGIAHFPFVFSSQAIWEAVLGDRFLLLLLIKV